jgi:hypothetical protein
MNTDEQTNSETHLINLDEVVEKTKNKTNIVMDSQIFNTIMACPQLCDFRFNHNFQAIKGKSNSLEIGSAVHVYMEYYYGAIIKGKSKSDAHIIGMNKCKEYFTGCLICVSGEKCDYHKKEKWEGTRNTPIESEGNLVGSNFVYDSLELYHTHYKNESIVPLEVEVVKSKIVYEDDEIRVLWKAKLDLVADNNNGIYPYDHKSAKQNRPKIKMNAQMRGQCFIMGTRNVFINVFGFQKTLPANERFKREVLSFSAETLLEWQSKDIPTYAYALKQYAETGYWPRNYTHCEGKYGTCAFLEVCEANEEMREEVLKNNFIVGPEWNPTNEEE